jgi:hypothetical protein
MVNRFVSAPLPLAPGLAAGDYARADLIFYGVDHSEGSYEARVYINDPRADHATGRDDPAYAGSFFIFGHGGCFGDLGHRDIPTGPRDPFDLRAPHQLTPATKVVIVTEPLKRIVAGATDKGSVTVTVVTLAPRRPTNTYLSFDQIRPTHSADLRLTRRTVGRLPPRFAVSSAGETPGGSRAI